MVRIGGLSAGIGARALGGAITELASGRKPNPADLFFTPTNARRVADTLAKMRGAALKVGQMMSMDAGDVLPREIAAILDRLRDDADPMPPKQLRDVLDRAWGKGWLKHFARFDVRPMAAASIGQVHRARTKTGRDLAIKVQYPGIRSAIDSDVDAVARIIQMSGALPKELDLSSVFRDAKAQLHDEADYLREARAMTMFADLLEHDPSFTVPRPDAAFCTDDVLAMDYIHSRYITDLVEASQEERDQVAGHLITLVLRELFDFGLMQTDPNFANYHFDPETGQIVLLDFGATRTLEPPVQTAFHDLMTAGFAYDDDAAARAAETLGLFDPAWPDAHRAIMMEMFNLGMDAVRLDNIFDFDRNPLFTQLRDRGLEIGTERDFWHVPATETLLVQRKVAGTYLLAARLRAKVNLNTIVQQFSEPGPKALSA